MSDRFIDRVYQASDQDDLRVLYDSWATSYDADLSELDFATPARVAEALARHMKTDGPILDFGCGTGLSGAALADKGFTRIDGFDVSERMLERAQKLGIYTQLIHAGPDDALPFDQGEYDAVTASAAISPGAAPGRRLDDVIAILETGGLFVVSLNHLALEDPDYRVRIEDAISEGRVEVLEAMDGPHLPGADLDAKVFVLRRC